MIRIMGYIKSALLEETGYVVLDRYDKPIDPKAPRVPTTGISPPTAVNQSELATGQQQR